MDHAIPLSAKSMTFIAGYWGGYWGPGTTTQPLGGFLLRRCVWTPELPLESDRAFCSTHYETTNEAGELVFQGMKAQNIIARNFFPLPTFLALFTGLTKTTLFLIVKIINLVFHPVALHCLHSLTCPMRQHPENIEHNSPLHVSAVLVEMTEDVAWGSWGSFGLLSTLTIEQECHLCRLAQTINYQTFQSVSTGKWRSAHLLRLSLRPESGYKNPDVCCCTYALESSQYTECLPQGAATICSPLMHAGRWQVHCSMCLATWQSPSGRTALTRPPTTRRKFVRQWLAPTSSQETFWRQLRGYQLREQGTSYVASP